MYPPTASPYSCRRPKPPLMPSWHLETNGQETGRGVESERQTENLDRWGYPYVFDDFRFHMTLTGRIDAGRRSAIVALLQTRFNAIDGAHVLRVGQLALLRQDGRGPFRIVREAALTALHPGQ